MIYNNLINILDYINTDNKKSGDGYSIYYFVYSVIYNNIIIQITSYSNFTQSNI
jgi:hypothetical protein